MNSPHRSASPHRSLSPYRSASLGMHHMDTASLCRPGACDGGSGGPMDTPGPWLSAWIEFQIDARINQALREVASGELTGIKTSHSEDERTVGYLQSEVRALAESQAKLVELVEGLSLDISRLSEGAGEVLPTHREEIAELASAVEELRRLQADSAAKHGDGLDEMRRLHESRHESSLQELRRLQDEHRETLSLEVRELHFKHQDSFAKKISQDQQDSHEAGVREVRRLCDSRHEATALEVRRLQSEHISRLEASLRTATADTKRLDEALVHHCEKQQLHSEEVGKLGPALDKLQSRVSQWRGEVAQRIDREVHEFHASAFANAQKLQDVSLRQKQMEADLATLAGAGIGPESRNKRVERELASLVEIAQALGARLQAAEGKLQASAIEAQRFAGVVKALETRLENRERKLAELKESRSDEGSWLRDEVERLREAFIALERRMEVSEGELVTVLNEHGQRLEQRHAPLAESQRSHEARLRVAELRMQELSTACQQLDDLNGGDVRSVKLEIEAGIGQLQDRFDKERAEMRATLDAWHLEVEGGLEAALRRSLVELRGELRSETAAISRLDEQLWHTDQRLGQRIDELMRIHVATTNSEFPGASGPQPPRSPHKMASARASRDLQSGTQCGDLLHFSAVSSPSGALAATYTTSDISPDAVADSCGDAQPTSRSGTRSRTDLNDIAPGGSRDSASALAMAHAAAETLAQKAMGISPRGKSNRSASVDGDIGHDHALSLTEPTHSHFRVSATSRGQLGGDLRTKPCSPRRPSASDVLNEARSILAASRKANQSSASRESARRRVSSDTADADKDPTFACHHVSDTVDEAAIATRTGERNVGILSREDSVASQRSASEDREAKSSSCAQAAASPSHRAKSGALRRVSFSE